MSVMSYFKCEDCEYCWDLESYPDHSNACPMCGSCEIEVEEIDSPLSDKMVAVVTVIQDMVDCDILKYRCRNNEVIVATTIASDLHWVGRELIIKLWLEEDLLVFDYLDFYPSVCSIDVKLDQIFKLIRMNKVRPPMLHFLAGVAK